MTEMFFLTFTPYSKDDNGREVSKEEDFVGYKKDFEFRFFKENTLDQPRKLPIDGSHISSPNISPVIECDDS